MTPAVIHVLFVLAQAQRIAPTHLQAFPGLKRLESSRICVSPTGMEAKKKHIGDDDAIHNILVGDSDIQGRYLESTQCFRTFERNLILSV